jgi:cbb3-type cytochrome oxidase maturation protein
MSIIYLLIPIAIIFTAIGIYFFFWAVKSEQFSDLEKQGMSILFDDAPKKSKMDESEQVLNDQKTETSATHSPTKD